jgi:hypothetical protein
MATTHPAKHFSRRSDPWTLGPQVTFAVAVLTAFAAVAVTTINLPRDFVLPLTGTLFFILAGLVALLAWSRGHPFEHGQAARRVTYWDVAGALTFIGICIAALTDPDQMVRLMEGTHREN